MSSRRRLVRCVVVAMALLLLLAAAGDRLLVAARICGSVRVQTHVGDMERLRGCTTITGNLSIMLIETGSEAQWARLRFPELLEITAFLLVFQVHHLRSLGALFPNLRAIKGVGTFESAALIIYHVPQMQEIGLTSLRRIERGTVRISDSPNLCYYDTIDWGLLGTELKAPNQSSGECPACPEVCNGRCWSATECQRNETIVTCPKFVNDDLCVDRCPDDKLVLEIGSECISPQQCHLIDAKRNWFAYNNTCVPECPLHYRQQNDSCAYCGEQCQVICNPASVVSTLQSVKTLRGCTHINGSLHISISDEAVARELDHLRDIVEIWGSLLVTRSPSLRSLAFLAGLQLIRGDVLHMRNFSLVVLENQRLRQLWPHNATARLSIAHGAFFFHYNPQLCFSEIERLNAATLRAALPPLQVSRDSNGDQRLCEEFALDTAGSTVHATNITLRWRYDLADRNLRGFLVYYMETADVPLDSAPAETCRTNAWSVQFTETNATLLAGLRPFTNYSFYVVVSALKGSAQRRTRVFNIATLSDDPSGPRDVRVLAHNASALHLSWLPPAEPNGVLDRYVIAYAKLIDDVTALRTRDYCQHPGSGVFVDGLPFVQSAPPPTAIDRCACAARRATRSADERARTRWSDDGDLNDFVGLTNHSALESSRYHYDWSSTAADYMEQIVPANQTSTLITQLDHFATYVFYVSACNANRTATPQCSEVVSVYNRTKRLQAADTLVEFRLVEREAGVLLEWRDPRAPNALITSYTVEWRTDASSDHVCVPAQHAAGGYLLHLAAGDYRIRVRANTLAGAGDFTPFRRHVRAAAAGGHVLATTLGCLLAVGAALVGVGACAYVRRRRRRAHDHLQLIASVNPEYWPAYVADEWELARADVDVRHSLGRGVFGVVYSGVLRSTGMACAVKSVAANATRAEQLAFLHEAGVMKAFSGAHHVVRLVGVVSRAGAPLVVMELMERGDLKHYLRQARAPPALACSELYRMAVEIADGMAYLAAKKFVHRDLAARNCMVAADRTVKVGDFGMARDVYETDYYRKDTRGLLPVRWMAPESLADGVFTSDSDAWSYGVVLWEMATLAEQPYQGLGSAQVLQFVVARGRLERPPACPDLLYAVMDACWRWHPSRRPRFLDVVGELQQHVREDFAAVSFYHSREGSEHRLHATERPFNPPALAQGGGVAYFHAAEDGGSECHLATTPSRERSLLMDYAYDDDGDDGGGKDASSPL